MAKDPGVYSSRINQIVKQAAKYPAPGKYLAHTDWKNNGGNAFCKVERTYKSMHKVPDPRHYERGDFNLQVSNASKDNLSQNPRTLLGNMSKGKRRSFLDGAIRHGETVPPPCHYNVIQFKSDRLPGKLAKMTDWKAEANKTKGRGTPEKEIGPNHYHPNFKQCEDTLPDWTVPKEVGKNFLDKAVREKMVDTRSKIPIPGPGGYETHNFRDDRVTRGTKHVQLRGLSRSSISGYL